MAYNHGRKEQVSLQFVMLCNATETTSDAGKRFLYLQFKNLVRRQECNGKHTLN